MKTVKKQLFSSLYGLLFFQCTVFMHAQPVHASTNEIDSLIKAYNQTGFDVFKTCNHKLAGDSNLLLSPFSISMAMAMAYNGAGSETKSEMQEVLHLHKLSIHNLNQANAAVLTMLRRPGADTLHIANSLWYRDKISMVRDFITACRQSYQSATESYHTEDLQASRDTINAWVRDNTGKNIQEIIERIYRDDVLFIINAIYFKGTWLKTFDQDATENSPFTLASGRKINVPVMAQMDTFPMLMHDDFKMMELPFSGGTYSMLLFLADEDFGMDSLISRLQQEKCDHWEQGMHARAVQLYLPKFRFDYSDDLADEFISLGMKQAFEPSADFTNILRKGELWISRVNHKTFIEINEKGAETAAANAVVFSYGNNPVLFEANRPFLFLIRHNESGANLFMGKVAKPRYEDIKKGIQRSIDKPNQDKGDAPYTIQYNAGNKLVVITLNQKEPLPASLEVDLIDLTGKVIRTWNIKEDIDDAMQIRLPKLVKTIYILRINSNNTVQTHKILVK